MEKTIGNYTTQPNNDFPLDCETLENIENNRSMVELLGNIAGDKVILNGCGLYNSGTMRYPGYVFMRTADCPEGEVLRFAGGSVAQGIYVSKENVSVTANASEYPNAYTVRSLLAGIGEENYSWNDFVDISDKTNRQLRSDLDSLKSQVESLQPAPIGAIHIWPSSNIPVNYMLCDGSSLSKDDYEQLFAVIGTAFGGSGNLFNLPDMRGRFVAGNGANGYNTINTKGGANTVTLTAAQSGLPSHTHTAFQSKAVKDKKGINVAGSYNVVTDISSSNQTTGAVDAKNATAAHENRPPYIVMNYIIKVR